MTTEYAAALEVIRAATARFKTVQSAYRAGTVDTTDYIKARREYVAAGEVFDAAYIAEREGTQACRDCGETFPYDPDADYCPACCEENNPTTAPLFSARVER